MTSPLPYRPAPDNFIDEHDPRQRPSRGRASPG